MPPPESVTNSLHHFACSIFSIDKILHSFAPLWYAAEMVYHTWPPKVVARDCAQATQLKWNINAGERVSGKSAKVLKWILE